MTDEGEDYIKFIQKYRKIRNLPLGGTRAKDKKPSEPTLRCVMSVGILDDRGQLPFRFALSSFKLSYPITSYGCIVRYKPINEPPKYLCIQRTNTIEYIDFIRGNYRESSLYYLLRCLTTEERERLCKYDFDTLWKDHTTLTGTDTYTWAKNLFSKYKNLDKILAEVQSIDPDGKNNWLFPKGKIEYLTASPPVQESPWEAAKREFQEETNGLSLENCKFILSDPVQELYFGSNSKNYATNYFLLESPTEMPIKQFEKIKTDIREVSTGEVENIYWISSNDLDKYLNPRRLNLIRQIEALDLKVTELNSCWKTPFENDDLILEN